MVACIRLALQHILIILPRRRNAVPPVIMKVICWVWVLYRLLHGLQVLLKILIADILEVWLDLLLLGSVSRRCKPIGLSGFNREVSYSLIVAKRGENGGCFIPAGVFDLQNSLYVLYLWLHSLNLTSYNIFDHADLDFWKNGLLITNSQFLDTLNLALTLLDNKLYFHDNLVLFDTKFGNSLPRKNHFPETVQLLVQVLKLLAYWLKLWKNFI